MTGQKIFYMHMIPDGVLERYEGQVLLAGTDTGRSERGILFGFSNLNFIHLSVFTHTHTDLQLHLYMLSYRKCKKTLFTLTSN